MADPPVKGEPGNVKLPNGEHKAEAPPVLVLTPAELTLESANAADSKALTDAAATAASGHGVIDTLRAVAAGDQTKSVPVDDKARAAAAATAQAQEHSGLAGDKTHQADGSNGEKPPPAPAPDRARSRKEYLKPPKLSTVITCVAGGASAICALILAYGLLVHVNTSLKAISARSSLWDVPEQVLTKRIKEAESTDDFENAVALARVFGEHERRSLQRSSIVGAMLFSACLLIFLGAALLCVDAGETAKLNVQLSTGGGSATIPRSVYAVLAIIVGAVLLGGSLLEDTPLVTGDSSSAIAVKFFGDGKTTTEREIEAMANRLDALEKPKTTTPGPATPGASAAPGSTTTPNGS